jgi:hypothetical protein
MQHCRFPASRRKDRNEAQFPSCAQKMAPNVIPGRRGSVRSSLTRGIAASTYERMSSTLREPATRLIGRHREATTYRQLAAWGDRPAAMIDVGAYRGDWTRSARQMFGLVPASMIEAQSALIPSFEGIADKENDIAVAHAIDAVVWSRSNSCLRSGVPYCGEEFPVLARGR